MEERLAAVEQRLDNGARSELQELKARVDGLQEKVRSLEACFDIWSAPRRIPSAALALGRFFTGGSVLRTGR